MIETYLWQVFILLVTCFVEPLAFSASYLLMVTHDLALLSITDVITPLGLALAFPSVTTLNVTAYTTVWMEQGGGLLMGVLILLIAVPLCCYLFYISSRGGSWMQSRRIQQATNVMLLVYAVILCFAAIKLISFAIPVSFISTAFIFVISFVLLKKTRIPLFMVLAIGILIALFLI